LVQIEKQFLGLMQSYQFHACSQLDFRARQGEDVAIPRMITEAWASFALSARGEKGVNPHE
jgi:hypothetical protein